MLLEKIYKYEMDPASIFEETEQTRFHPQMDGQTDNMKPVYPFFNFVEAGGINLHFNKSDSQRTFWDQQFNESGVTLGHSQEKWGLTTVVGYF